MELYLILPAPPEHLEGPTEHIADRKWYLSGPHGRTEETAYHCVSYQWGGDRAPNLFSRPGDASTRTRAALEAAMRCNQDSPHQAYWIDAVCVPAAGPSRRATLESMGFLYAQAKSVIVVLESDTLSRISPDFDPDVPLSDEDMKPLDRDLWATRVWTYQEIVNAQELYFTAYDMEEPSKIYGLRFLNWIGFSLQKWKQRNQVSAVESYITFPGLNALEDACADWQTAGFVSRSMLTCLTGVEGRRHDDRFPSSRLYAVMGAFTDEAVWGPADESVAGVAAKLMQLCEVKEDFSYLYTSDLRNESSEGRRWRPKASSTSLIPILKWHCWGSGQPGKLNEQSLELYDMVILDTSAEPNQEVISEIGKWLFDFAGVRVDDPSDVEEVKSCLPSALEPIGWKGTKRCHSCHAGLILLQDALPLGGDIEAYASSSIRWAFGAPGIAKITREGAVVGYSPLVAVVPGLHGLPRTTAFLPH